MREDPDKMRYYQLQIEAHKDGPELFRVKIRQLIVSPSWFGSGACKVLNRIIFSHMGSAVVAHLQVIVTTFGEEMPPRRTAVALYPINAMYVISVSSHR